MLHIGQNNTLAWSLILDEFGNSIIELGIEQTSPVVHLLVTLLGFPSVGATDKKKTVRQTVKKSTKSSFSSFIKRISIILSYFPHSFVLFCFCFFVLLDRLHFDITLKYASYFIHLGHSHRDRFCTYFRRLLKRNKITAAQRTSAFRSRGSHITIRSRSHSASS